MTEKLMEEFGDLQWVSGSDFLSDLQPQISTVGVYENEDGHRLRVRISGPEEDVRQFIETMQIAFRIREGEGELEHGDGEELTGGVGSHVASVQIDFEFLDIEPPYAWDILIDPKFDIGISGASRPHVYSTTASKSVKATITAEGGKLTMSMGGDKVTVGNGNLKRDSISRRTQFSWKYQITVDGLANSNQYDLHLSGANFA